MSHHQENISCYSQVRPVFIKMPATAEERLRVKSGFYALANFPNVICAVDCTHIKYQSVGGPRAELFRNRKGYFSLNTQAVCDAQLRIQDIICRWPGSVHDTTIFNDSHIRADFENGVYGNDFLLGDSGYPCRTYLLTPFLQPRTNGEEAYNRAQVATRNPIERCFGVLKRRFPCLSMGLQVNLDTAMNIVVACAVLHNIALNYNDNIEDMIDIEAAIPEEMHEIAGRNENATVRSSLVATHFNK
ncbi:putative nuclease HARBI1 [Diabrotica virgifera virgifera]|uniref:DDE Tnp4 domain-containing protein n=1 Tax=Diabrotica virgifera virgifera TaxID=50390 RepID=A0ABM5L6L9_DIAVI|nr:putative nuclease HARBI1 [Diabrotica virgifera virgifera]